MPASSSRSFVTSVASVVKPSERTWLARYSRSPRKPRGTEVGVVQVTRQVGDGVTVGGYCLQEPAFLLEWVVQLLRSRQALPHLPHPGGERADPLQQGRVVEVAEHLVPVGDQIKL